MVEKVGELSKLLCIHAPLGTKSLSGKLKRSSLGLAIGGYRIL